MIVGFTQEDGAPPGAGIFHTDDGASFAGYSPEHAAPFLATPPDNIAVKVPRGAPAPVDPMAPQELWAGQRCKDSFLRTVAISHSIDGRITNQIYPRAYM